MWIILNMNMIFFQHEIKQSVIIIDKPGTQASNILIRQMPNAQIDCKTLIMLAAKHMQAVRYGCNDQGLLQHATEVQMQGIYKVHHFRTNAT